jgi:FkbM family methyltransferase
VSLVRQVAQRWKRRRSKQIVTACDNDSHPSANARLFLQWVQVVVGGHTFELAVDRDADDGYTDWIRSGAGTDAPVTWAQRFVRPHWNILDLGANVGTFALALAHDCRQVVAVEAMPDNAALLTASAARSAHTIVPVHAAVVDVTGTIGMSDRSAWARVRSDGKTVVPALSIQDLAAVFGEQPFDLVKIDIEGAEPLVIPGVLELARDRDDFILIYESNQAVTDIDVRSMHRAVAAAGFRLWYLDPSDHQPYLLDPDVAQYTLNVDVLAIKGAVGGQITAPAMDVEQLVERLHRDMTTHPITITRSYAHVVARHLPDAITDHELIRAAATSPPVHPGASAELDRFKSLLEMT